MVDTVGLLLDLTEPWWRGVFSDNIRHLMTQVHQTTSDICLDAEYVRCLLRFRNTEAIFSIDARFWYSLTLSLVKPDSRYSVALKKTSNSISVPKLGPCSLFTVLHGSQWLKLGEIMRRCRQVHTRYYTTGLD